MKTNSNKVDNTYVVTAHIEFLIEASSIEIANQKVKKSIIGPLKNLEKGWGKHRIAVILEEFPNECLVA